jgi:hypothetical protein
MIDRATVIRTLATLRRIGWLAVVALPIILAACGKGGTTGY